MTRAEFELELSKSSRWGYNEQPELDWLLDYFDKNGLLDAIALVKTIDEDTIRIRFSPEKTTRQVIEIIDSLHADGIDQVDGETFTFWWD